MLTKDDWKIIISNELSKVNDKYDSLQILTVLSSHRTIRTYGGDRVQIATWSVNYKTTRGEWSTGFGTFEYDKNKIDAILREAKINSILQ